MLLVTGSDQYIGYSILSHLAQYEQLRPNLRATCQNKARCHGFIRNGIDAREVEYCHPNQISHTLRGVDQIILVVGNESNRVDNAKHICQVAAQSGVSSIICVSHVGAVSKTHQSLQEYNQIEQEVMNTGCQYTILRLDFVQQYFHLWSNYAEKNRQLILPISDDAKICPIDITDVCKVIELLCLDKDTHLCKPLDDEHDGQVYSLTGPEAVHGGQMTNYLIKATGYQQFKMCHSRPMDLGYYLSNLSKDVWFDGRLKREMSQIYHDEYDNNDYKSKSYSLPSEKQVQTILDYFNWVQQTSGSVCVPHLNMLTRTAGKSLENFFEENANSFKPRV